MRERFEKSLRYVFIDAKSRVSASNLAPKLTSELSNVNNGHKEDAIIDEGREVLPKNRKSARRVFPLHERTLFWIYFVPRFAS